MRLTMRVSSVGDRWMARFPAITKPVKEFVDEKGRVDVGPIDDYYRQCGPEFVMINSDDDRGVKVAAYEFLWQLSCCIRHLETEKDGHNCKLVAETAEDRCLERKMNRGTFAFVRLDFDRHGTEGFVRMRIGIGNPKNVKGNVLNNARSYAVDCARIMMHIDRGLKDGSNGAAHIEICERDNEDSKGIIAEAIEKDRMQDEDKECKELEIMRSGCIRRINGFCSPVKRDCVLCNKGMCMTLDMYKFVKDCNKGKII